VAGLNADALVEKVERIRVNEFSQVKAMRIFAIGDIASMESLDFPQGHP
jgi:NADH dehydrogenase